MDESLKEYAPYWLIGYYHLERKGDVLVKYNYRTSVIGIHEFLFGVQRYLEQHHRAQVIIVFIEPIRGFMQDFKKKNVYVDFSAFANKLVTDELTKKCAAINEDFERQVECMLNVQNLRSDEMLRIANSNVKKIVENEVSDELVERVSKKLKYFWEEIVIKELLS